MRLGLIDRIRALLPAALGGKVFDETRAVPAPIGALEYPGDMRAALYRHSPGVFCYYHRSVLETVGLNDEAFINALEHLDHTYRITLAGLHPPYGYFPDLVHSDRYLVNIPGCMANSTIAKVPGMSVNVQNAHAHFLIKHAHAPRDLIRSAPKLDTQAKESIISLYRTVHVGGPPPRFLDRVPPDW